MSRRDIDLELKKSYTKYAIKWCEENLGFNTRKRRKLLVVMSERKRTQGKFVYYGNYCLYKNQITIYVNNCETLKNLVSTIIHEYTHYLQPMGKYKEYEKYYYYSTHPFERQARRNETKYTSTCLSFIRGKL
jgi:Zn-dependent peptidase ImmA (M78 family)